MNSEQFQEQWQVDSNGEIFDTNFAEMTSWIDQGTLLRGDKVRKGNLRWIEAGKVPSLISVFNARDNGQPAVPIVTATMLEPSQLPAVTQGITNHSHAEPYRAAPEQSRPAATYVCCVHIDRASEYICGTCFSEFCKLCPNSYGGTVKICPYCGALCKSRTFVETHDDRESHLRSRIAEGFGLADFGRAIAHPFRFKTSLIIGAAMYTIFSLGQSAAAVGGFFMLGASILCVLLCNMLTVGVLMNTVENFAQGKLDTNFMPSFEDFSIWDDVIHPFFLSIGVYLSSFGPFLAVILAAAFMVVGSANNTINTMQPDAARTAAPSLPYAANAAKQSEVVRELLRKNANVQEGRIDSIENGEGTPADAFSPSTPAEVERVNEVNFEEMDRMIQDQRKAQLESAIGKTPETVSSEREAFFKSIAGYGLLFLALGGITLLWGLFYFPAACAVAGYTRSFMATMNPTVGFDTIRRLGASYFLILLMALMLLIAGALAILVTGIIFSPFDMPAVGNVPGKIVGSILSFYLSVVFSCIIGYALFKASDRLQLVR